MAGINTDTQLKPSDFVHLHNHTHYSLLDGLQKIPEMLDRTAELGMSAIALTDHGTLSGAIEFYKQAKERDIKPIIGIESYVAPRGHTDKDGKQDANPFHIILLAMNNKGYENLMRLSTIASLDGFYYKPRVDKELLKKYNEGLIVLSACIGGEVGQALEQNNMAQAEKVAKWYKKVFGDRYYLELQDHGHEWELQQKVNEQIVELSQKLDIPMVVTADAHYALPEDQDAHEVLLCVQTGSLLEDDKRMSLKDMKLNLSDPKHLIERWGHMPEVITNTRKIAERCSIEIELGGMLIPKFEVPGDKSEKDYLIQKTYRGLAWRYGGAKKEESSPLSVEKAKKTLSVEILERAEFELGTIQKMGFSGYFLIIADFMDWGKERGIIFGPGRGSAAGSIVSYGLGITDIDPLKYDLLFERFLNPDRISMPDIDIDIMDSRRDEVIQYTVEKYGEDRVAHIVTFGTMAARNAIRDTARVLGVPYANADRLAKMVPPLIQGRHIPLAISIKDNQELKNEYETNPESKKVIDLAVRLEGTIRSHGVHAAGVVIAPDEIVKYTPLEMAQKGVVATQYSMGPIEDLGLLKMDFLGLSNLTIIKNALRIIRKVNKKDIEISTIPLDDKKTYELLSAGDTTGVFQLESSGMKRYIRELKPDTFEDIVAMVSLYRPGPLTAGLTQKFIDRKNGKEPVAYEHLSMKNALEPTYGVLVYQEQVMLIARDMCGFSGGQADTLRKAIGKKKRDVMAKMKKEFIEGAQKTSGVEKALAEKFWKDLEGFADYAFNKSHAACYALIAYQTAYLKAHYPAAFMAAILTSDFEDTDRIAVELSECRSLGIEVLPPDINESFVEFAVRPKDGAIRFGLAAIKNVGVGAVEKILEIRKEGGPFKSIEDFTSRVSAREVNKKTWESLIKAGAFDSFAPRSELIFNIDKILAFATKAQKDADSGQIDMFGGAMSDNAPLMKLELDPPPTTSNDKEFLQWEKELLGVYLSRHPLEKYEEYMQKYTTPLSELTTNMEGDKVQVAGLVTVVRKITTRTGDPMAFVTIEDPTVSLELVVFPKTYMEYSELWVEDKVIEVDGKVSTKDRDGKTGVEIKILANKAKELTPESVKRVRQKLQKNAHETEQKPRQAKTETNISGPKRLVINLPLGNDLNQLIKLKQLLSKNQGTDEVLVNVNGETTIKLPFGINVESDLIEQISSVVGSQAVKVSSL
ncbi:MAG: DNA polymerase III subunit alpha [Candidatus Saccharimonadales bacterium]